VNVNWGHQHGAAMQDVDKLFAADPLFCRRADCLDVEVVRSHVSAAFPEIDMSSGVQPVNVWYIPGKSLQVAYRARGTDDVAASGEVLFRVRFYPYGEGQRHADSARAAALDRRRVRHIPGMSGVAWLFPEDAGLPQLGAVLNDEYSAEHFMPGGRWTLLSYLPGRRCAVRYRFPDDADGIVVRVQMPHEAARSDGLRPAAWAGARFHMPEPAGFDAQAGAFWERFAPGQRLDSLLATDGFDAAVRHVLEGLVRLHALRLPELPSEGASEILDRTTRKIVPKVGVALPRLGDDLGRFTRLLIARASHFAEGEPVTLHGDLHTANLLIDGDDVVFIDLDRLCVGNAACDLALLGTRLLLVARHGGIGVHAVAGTIAALPDLYREAGGRQLEPGAFAWYVAALLVGRQIKTAIRHLAPNTDRLAPALLALALRILEQGAVDRALLIDDWDEVCGVHETTNQA
jgi:aminoglycoside phosphotransferase